MSNVVLTLSVTEPMLFNSRNTSRLRFLEDRSLLLVTKDLNDDLSSNLTVHQVAETRSKIDCPIYDPDAILASTGRSWDDLVSAT